MSLRASALNWIVDGVSRHFRIGRAGAVALVTALCAPVLVMIVGFVVDFSYASYINQRLARATDAATIGAVSQTAATAAGARLVTLENVYDAASISANEYTGLFTEQGNLVVKNCLPSKVLRVPVCSAGRTGAADVVDCKTVAA